MAVARRCMKEKSEPYNPLPYHINPYCANLVWRISFSVFGFAEPFEAFIA